MALGVCVVLAVCHKSLGCRHAIMDRIKDMGTIPTPILVGVDQASIPRLFGGHVVVYAGNRSLQGRDAIADGDGVGDVAHARHYMSLFQNAITISPLNN